MRGSASIETTLGSANCYTFPMFQRTLGLARKTSWHGCKETRQNDRPSSLIEWQKYRKPSRYDTVTTSHQAKILLNKQLMGCFPRNYCVLISGSTGHHAFVKLQKNGQGKIYHSTSSANLHNRHLRRWSLLQLIWLRSRNL